MENTSSTTQQLPLVALIGATNAGKSTLFNRLSDSRQAVTAKEESTTRDRVFGSVNWQGKHFMLADTGGLVLDQSEMYQNIRKQMEKAVDEADLVLFLYDAGEGLNDQAKNYLNSLRGKKTIWLVANKVDSFAREKKIFRHTDLGLPYYEVSAATGRGTGDLLEDLTNYLPNYTPIISSMPVIALIGRPNVGKSSLLNALVKSERAVVSPISGTTRDIVTEKLELNGREYLLADTAGVRRRGQITRGPEDFSVKRTLQAVERADAVIIVIDSTLGTSRGDLHLIYLAESLKKPLLLVFNKSDLLDQEATVKLHKHLGKFNYCFVSAKESKNLSEITNWLEANI
ncbi:ribosome biogenesis GTPase Der [Candidatus Berkelbacteria bacterium]|nr:ribosome biogenesis GTPase Der [Candidatus Berkelbacteria bacterium]